MKKPPVRLELTTCGLQNRETSPGDLVANGEEQATSGNSDDRNADECTANCPDVSKQPRTIMDELASIADALDSLPEVDRTAIVAHVHTLMRLPKNRRDAILTLAYV